MILCVFVLVTQSCLTLWLSWIAVRQAPEWVVFPFSRGSFLPRDQTWVSHIAARLFTIWATSEALSDLIILILKM